jgi:peptidoglycan/xylan/chitin deacetylase (PgdA/CDA1 family)
MASRYLEGNRDLLFRRALVLASVVAMLIGGFVAAPVTGAPGKDASVAGVIGAPLRVHAQARRVAVTFDDLPLGGPQFGLERMAAMTDRLVASIAAAGVPAVGFVNESKVDVDGEVEARLALLRTWTDAGLELGNHTYSHPSPHHVPLPQYFDDIVRGEPFTRMLLAERQRELRYFRHPFLRRGLTLEDKEAIDAFLAERGYTIAPVTIDNVDYLFSAVYTDAKTRGDEELMGRIADAYLEFSARIYEFYEGAAERLFGRSIAHVYLLHANELNADTFDRFVALTRARGYEFVTVDEALADPAYATEDHYAGPAGTSWLFRWDATQADSSGARKIDWRSEPIVQEWVQELFDKR